MTETERSLLDAVLENPDDDLPRLVYADYLDENGDPTRAEFIRAQITMSKSVADSAYDSDEYASASKFISTLSITVFKHWLSKSGFAVSGLNALTFDTNDDLIRITSESSSFGITFRRGFVYGLSATTRWIANNWNRISNSPILAMTLYIFRGNEITGSIAINISRQADSFCKVDALFANGRVLLNTISLACKTRTEYVLLFIDWLRDACRSNGCYDDAFPQPLR